MDIHKPKPVHSLKEFLSEIGVIVCGILIALAGEQVVERMEWAHKVREAREALTSELGEDLGQGQLRVTVQDCVERRLDELAGVVDLAASSGRLPPLPAPGVPPFFTWDTGIWKGVVAAQTSTHMDPEVLKGYVAVYEFISQVSDENRQELRTWTRLYTLAGPGRRFEPAEGSAYREAIAQARLANRSIGLSMVRARQIADAWALHYDRKQFQSYSERPRNTVAVCQPLGTGRVEHYGEAPLNGVVPFALQHPITRDDVGLPASQKR